VIFKLIIFANVTVPIPDVNQAKGSLRNVIAVVLNKNEDNLYQLGTKEGVLNKMYARSEFDICKQAFVQINQVCRISEISLRTAATFIAGGSTQGFVRCHCRKKCQHNWCNCKKNEL